MNKKLDRKRATAAIVGLAVLVAAIVTIIAVRSASNRPDWSRLLPEETVRQAFDYGRGHRQDLMVDFQAPWTVLLGYDRDKGRAVIYTPAHCLAQMVRNLDPGEPVADTASVCDLAGGYINSVWFGVELYGEDTGFDSQFKASVLVDTQVVEPIKTVYRGSESAREYTVISRHDYHFPVSILDGRKKIVLRISRAEGQPPIDFSFDLKQIP